MKKKSLLIGIMGVLSFCVLVAQALAKENADGFAVLDHVEGLADPMEGKEADFSALENLNNIRDEVHKAKQAHNKKQSLNSFRETLEKYKLMQLYHEAVLANLQASEECVNQFVGKYYSNAMLSWVGKNCGFYQDGMYCHYATEKKASDDSASKGEYDILCPGDITHKCYVKNLSAISERSGISGYLMGLYAEAKKQEATSSENAYLAEGDYEKFEEGLEKNAEEKDSPYISPQDMDLHMSVPSFDKLTANKNYDDKSNQQIKHPSAQKDIEAETRKNGLLNWTLGSVVSKEMANDLVNPAPRFGQVKQKFPLWNDQKEFYDQYINGKYDNIKDYIIQKTSALSLLTGVAQKAVDVMPFTDIQNEDGTMISADQQKEKDAQEIKTLAATEEENSFKDEFAQKIQKRAQDYAAIIKKFTDTSLFDREQKIYTELDSLGDQLDKAQEAYSNANEVIAAAESSVPEAKDSLSYVDELYADRSDNGNIYEKNPVNKDLNASINEHEYKKARNESQKAELETKINDLRTRINQKNKELEDVQNALSEAKKERVLQISDVNAENNMEIEQARQERKESLADKIADIITRISAMGIANNLSSCVRQYALEQVDMAVKQLQIMQDNETIYYSVNAPKVQKIHKELIDKLTNINPSDLKCDLSASGMISAEVGQRLITQLLNLFKDDCKDDYCITPDEEYFVGIIGKHEDMKAPKDPVEFTSAPLREVFHFDMQDYDNIDKYYKGDDIPWNNEEVTTTAESFLNSGADLPMIWRYILRDHAFVEKDMDWKALFERGDAAKSYLRSGTFPCMLDGEVIDAISAEKDLIGYTVNKTSDVNKYKELPKCRGLSLKGSKHTSFVSDNEVGYGVTLNILAVDQTKDVSQSSELGNILAYVPDPRFSATADVDGKSDKNTRYKLTFNPALQKAVYWANQEILQEKDTDSLENDAKVYQGTRSLLTRNQFGDYLNNVELEKKAVDMLEELQVKIIDLQAALRTMFNELGYDLPEDFDLTQDQDFKLAEEKIDTYKNAYIRHALTELDKLNVKTEKVQNDIDAVKHEIAVMRKDDNEKVFISGDEDLDELSEKIKNSEADQSLNNEYQKKVVEEMMRQISAIPAPYCSSYPNK